jgi:hypothetical protein
MRSVRPLHSVGKYLIEAQLLPSSICRKWVDVFGNGALRIGARIVVRTGSILNGYVQLLRSL